MVNFKKCTKCNEKKEIKQFGKNIRYKDGFTNHCKKCVADNSRKWRKENPSRAKEAGAMWQKNNYGWWRDNTYIANKENQNINSKKYYKKNAQEILKNKKKWRKENPDKALIVDIKRTFRRYRDIKISTELAELWALNIKAQRLIKQLKLKTK